jgi:uncharacterized protein YjbJ (UPF0337 family)
MGEIFDKVKGKAKQVEGVITRDKARQQEGEREEAKGNIKGIVNKVEHAVHKGVDAMKHVVKKI